MSIEDLKVIEAINALVKDIYKVTLKYPKNEEFGLISQMRRAAISIGSNLMEGNYRGSTKDYVHFIDIAKGSAAELKYQLLISKELKYISEKEQEILDKKIEEIIKTLSSIKRALKKKLEDKG